MFNKNEEKIMSNLREIFSEKFTENGDVAYSTTGSNILLDVLFMVEFYQKHIDKLPYIGMDDKARLFAMFIRDPRKGLGFRDLGRELLKTTNAGLYAIITAGRYDDLWMMFKDNTEKFHEALDFLKMEIEKGNELAKKWMPRYSSKNLMIAREIAKYWGMNKQQYGHFIKTSSTVEDKMSHHNDDDIKFEQVPSLAAIKYAKRFKESEATKDRYALFMESVKSGDAKIHVATSTVYDIFKNADKLEGDIDTFFDQIEKISGNWLPIVDTSGSMVDNNDSISKAMAIGHYLAKTSTFMPNTAVAFSSRPQLIKVGETRNCEALEALKVLGELKNVYMYGIGYKKLSDKLQAFMKIENESQYAREMLSLYTGDCSNTDFGAVMRLLGKLENPEDTPEYLVVLSDMEFDRGSRMSKDETMRMFKRMGINTKIVWWNFNTHNTTCPETDRYGNIYLSGYSPMLLKFLESGFDGNSFLDKLLEEYKKYLHTLSY